jgi:hypothetical protein
MSEIDKSRTTAAQFGAHAAVFEPPDFVLVELHGPLSDTDAVAVLQWLDMIRAQTGPLAALYDIRGLDRIPRITKNFPHQSNAANYYCGLALVGASFTVRVALSLMLNAVRLLNRDNSRFAFEFFSSTDDARAWLGKLERNPDSR